MGKTGSKQRPNSRAAVEASLAAASSRLSSAVQVKPGRIMIRLTDLDETCCLGGDGRTLSVTGASDTETPLVEVSGRSSVIKSILDGKKEPAKAFAAGGIMVRGDLDYLESLLTDSGLLHCGE